MSEAGLFANDTGQFHSLTLQSFLPSFRPLALDLVVVRSQFLSTLLGDLQGTLYSLAAKIRLDHVQSKTQFATFTNVLDVTA